MNRIITTLALAAIGGTAMAEAPADSIKTANDIEEVFHFIDVKTIPTTSVKDQNKSGTCWCFASTSFIEDEILRNGGDSIDLSEMFTVRQCYLEKADRYIRLYGQTNFVAGGSSIDVPYVIEKYGAVPESVYPGIQYGEDKHVHGELDAALKGYLDAVKRKPNGRLSTSWRKGVEAILDAYLGEMPETFTVDGVTYTPRTYADQLPVKMSDYVPLTSFSHHPFYKPFAIEVPDNWLWEKYYNLPLDEFKRVIDNAIENGYPVVWAADVSEGGFKWTEGFAVIPEPTDEQSLEGTELSRWVKMSDRDRASKRYDVKGPCKEIEVTQESRQEMFDRQETTDDHGMEIIGIARDQKGNRFYKVKNSWDTNQVYDGYFYVSEPYLLAKTIDILVHRDAIPKDIRKKLSL